MFWMKGQYNDVTKKTAIEAHVEFDCCPDTGDHGHGTFLLDGNGYKLEADGQQHTIYDTRDHDIVKGRVGLVHRAYMVCCEKIPNFDPHKVGPANWPDRNNNKNRFKFCCGCLAMYHTADHCIQGLCECENNCAQCADNYSFCLTYAKRVQKATMTNTDHKVSRIQIHCEKHTCFECGAEHHPLKDKILAEQIALNTGSTFMPAERMNDEDKNIIWG